MARDRRNFIVALNSGGGRSSVVEFQPSKLAVAGSNPVARSIPSLLDRERLRVAQRGDGMLLERKGQEADGRGCPRSSVGRARPW